MHEAPSFTMTLPTRRDVLLRGGYLITMDPDLGDLATGDVLIRDGRIERVASRVEVGDAAADDVTVIDVSHHAVLPGFVDTHWHLWSSILRGVIGEGERGYFPVKNRLAPHFTPAATEVSAALALAEAASAGITTVNAWDHNVRSPAFADAHARAILASGLRARYSYGNEDKLDPGRLMDLADVARFGRDWIGAAGDGRITLGMAMRGPVRTSDEVCAREWAFARDNGLPMTMHCGGRRDESGRYCELTRMGAAGQLGPDLQIVHAVHATPDEIELLARTGTHLSLSPLTEYRSMGIPPLGAFREAGIPVSLSIDTLAIPTTADMFLQMKTALSVEWGRVGGHTITHREILEMATLGGARDLGLDAVTGSLTPGKRGDVIAVRLDSLNMTPAADPLAVVVLCGTPADVDLVLADGRVLKHEGRLTAVDPRALAEAARATLRDLVARSGWNLPLGIAADGASAPASP